MSTQKERNARRAERDGVKKKKAPTKKKAPVKKKSSKKKVSEEASPERSSAEDKKVEEVIELDAFDG